MPGPALSEFPRAELVAYPSASPIARGAWGLSTALAATLVLPALLYFAIQRSGYDDLLGLSRTHFAGEEHWLMPAVIVSTTAALLIPGLALAVALRLLGCSKASQRCYLGWASLVLFVLMLDLDLLRSIGRHVLDVVEVALLPQGQAAGGNGLGKWVWTVGKWLSFSILGSAGTTLLCQEVIGALSSRITPVVRGTLAAAAGLCLAALALGPHLMRDGWRNPALFERTYGTLLLDLRWGSAEPDDAELADPMLRSLYPRLRQAYKSSFPTLLSGKPADARAVALAGRPPNVILIVAESLRQDAFGSELMPRLTRWAQNGLVAAQHEAGTIYSQAALFALLYGRSPAVFHQTLDAQVPPQFCVTLRASGYECNYFSGHPKVWLRREEYVNERTMDRFVHDDRGTWPEWDQRALDNMVERVSRSETPVFAIVLLMSSHFEYQYPPKYEVDLPVSDSSWRVTNISTLGPDAQVPQRNRYRNSVRFVDDVVADAVAKLDPQRNLVIFTGDHGESLYDDGHFSHGYAFSDVVTRTPLAMVGPGVAPSRLEHLTSHVDVLPTVLHALSGKHQHVDHIQGRDWFEYEPRSSFLQTYSPDPRDRIKAQLHSEGLRLRLDLELTGPRITLLGFEDAFGQLLPTPSITPNAAERLAQAFEAELLELRL